MTERKDEFRWPPPNGTPFEIPVPTKTIGLFDFIDGHLNVVMHVLSVAADVASTSIPSAWLPYLTPGKETWFRPTNKPGFGTNFTIKCIWQRIAIGLGQLEPWMTQWRNCGKDLIDASTDWATYDGNTAQKYTPSRVLSSAVDPVEQVSPLRDRLYPSGIASPEAVAMGPGLDQGRSGGGAQESGRVASDHRCVRAVRGNAPGVLHQTWA